MPPVGTSRGVECAAYGCSSRFYNKDMSRSPFHFFSFPSDRKRRDRWCMKIKRVHGRNGFVVGKSTQICHLHFKDEDIRKTLNGIWRLKPDAEPKDVLSGLSPSKRRVLQRCNLHRFTSSGSASEQPTDDNEPVSSDESLSDSRSEFDAHINVLNESEHSNEVTELKETVQRLQRTINCLNEKNEQKKFINTLENDDSLTKHYTGFPSYSVLLAMLSFLNPGDNCENVIAYTPNTETAPSVLQQPVTKDADHTYASSRRTPNKPGKVAHLSAKEQFILVLCRLRQGFSVKHLAYLFGTSESSVNRHFVTWINFMYFKLRSLPIWPSKDTVLKTMPQSFKDKYPDTRVIIDCSEICAQVPDSLTLQSMFWSNYKHHMTYKGLLGIAPSGAITFISQLYPGSVSDREIVIRSGFLDPKFFEKDDVVMADRGFTIEDLLKRMDVKLNIPTFLRGKDQFEQAETIETQQIAAERIHVERAINKVKKFRIFNSPIPLSMLGSINQFVVY